MPECVNAASCAIYPMAGKPADVAGECPLCDACLIVAARDIRALRLDYGDLEQLMPRASGVMSTRVGGSPEPGIPISLAVDALQRDIAWTLAAWEPPVREAAGLPAERVRGVRPGWAVATAVAVIAPRVEILAALPLTCGYADGLDAGPVLRDGVDAIDALRELHRAARAALGLTRLVHRLPGGCARCGAEALQRDNGADLVGCGQCGATLTVDDYRQYVAMTLVAATSDRHQAR